jgi:hypothetical protein
MTERAFPTEKQPGGVPVSVGNKLLDKLFALVRFRYRHCSSMKAGIVFHLGENRCVRRPELRIDCCSHHIPVHTSIWRASLPCDMSLMPVTLVREKLSGPNGGNKCLRFPQQICCVIGGRKTVVSQSAISEKLCARPSQPRCGNKLRQSVIGGIKRDMPAIGRNGYTGPRELRRP